MGNSARLPHATPASSTDGMVVQKSAEGIVGGKAEGPNMKDRDSRRRGHGAKPEKSPGMR